MEVQDHGHIIEVCGDVQAVGPSIVGSKICGDAPSCGFSDAKNSSKDAKERSASMRKLCIAVVLCIVFMSVEVVGGIKANSLAILTDAAHLLSDVAAFAISLFSLWASGWEATPRQSYGFFRIEILGALVSIQMIWLLAGILVYEAIVRLINGPGEVKGLLMFAVSTFGVTMHHHHHDEKGAASDGVEHHHHHHHHHEHKESTTVPLLDSSRKVTKTQKKQRNINVQGAYLHVLGDSIQSIGVMIGGAIIWYRPEYMILDLICTLIFSAIVLCTTIQMLRNILEVLMESTPREVDATKLEKGLCEMEEVVAIHELHIWAITVGKILLACHVIIKPEANADMVLDKVIEYIRREYNISHVTIQIERQ
ncbi:metal tolerance protein A2 isoform X3 [Cucumis melo var. makuwa]|uniref:Metal tolerance protein A2 isoform X3 n=1 Tax=Cucumis melo var. makuwa TaxID=1194695 RepID=A0A5D3DMN0_CUCMM|nr:metal tolerance protein A2 isoform X3 [Cucumis melo var. makuwa]TYK24559.1 metal tolerance protein A2 isoform X3 [Cucumis melo var. makuwa]